MPRPSDAPQPVRLGLFPGLLGAIVLLAGLALLGNDWYIGVRYATCILALIMCVFAVQGKQYWWLIGLIPIAVVWNPVWPIPFDDLMMRVLHILGAALFVAIGVGIKVPVADKR